jgi:hypothetical protein
VFLFYLALSTAWSWPMARIDPDRIVTRHFDLYPTTWLMERAPEAWPRLWHGDSAWPVGESLARVDSFVLLVLGWLLRPAWSGLQVASLVAWLGPAISAWAAERVAHRVFRVPRPASLIAGVAFGFAGVAATAVLEGHVYHLLIPWLPLLLGACWESPPAEEPLAFRQGLWAGLWWALCLWTTAYFGILGVLLLALASLRHPWGRPGVVDRHLGTIAVALPNGLAYLAVFAQGGAWAGSGDDPAGVWKAGALHLASLAGWSDAMDLQGHSIGAPLGFVTLALLALAPRVLAGRRGWRLLAGLALASVALAIGRELRVYMEPEGTWWPAALVAELPGARWFRFPARLTWLWALGAGMVGARVLAGLGQRLGPRVVWGVLAASIVDVAVQQATPLRLRCHLATVPSAYLAAPEGRPVLDLFGQALDGSAVEMELWVRALGCFYQSRHGRPTLEVCIGTDVDSPREQVASWVMAAALDAGTPREALRARVEDLGLGAVALHVDGFQGSDRQSLTRAFTELWGTPHESTDGGAHVLLWALPEGERPTPLETYARIAEEEARWERPSARMDRKMYEAPAPARSESPGTPPFGRGR